MEISLPLSLFSTSPFFLCTHTSAKGQHEKTFIVILSFTPPSVSLFLFGWRWLKRKMRRWRIIEVACVD
jgi:hypothetical protein